MLLVFFSYAPPPPRATLFPYTTLFRSPWRWSQGWIPAFRTSRIDPISAIRQSQEGRLPGAWAYPACSARLLERLFSVIDGDRKSTRLNSSHVATSYAVFCLKKKMHDST